MVDEVRNISLGTRNLEVRLSRRASRALERQVTPLHIEMELYFSCLIRKRVYFRQSGPPTTGLNAPLTGAVSVGFRPVMTRQCHVREVVGAPDVVDFPLSRLNDFAPRWLTLDYRHGSWSGEYGLTAQAD
jgi:hypothetical protein